MNPEPTGAAPAPAASKFGMSLADLLVAGGSLVILLFSFGPVVGFNNEHDNAVLDNIGRSLWSWLSPLGLFVILATVLLIASAVVDTWWQKGKAVKGGLHRHHLQVGLALFVLVTILGMGFADPYSSLGSGLTLGFGIAWGGVFQLLGALVTTGGAVLNYFDLLQNKVSLPASTPKPATYSPAQYAPGQVPVQGAAADPAASTTEMPRQDPPSA